MIRSALVTGATGAVGPALVHFLLEQDIAVTILTRQQSVLLGSRCKIVHGDVTDEQSVIAAATGTDVIFHLAGFLHVENPPPDLQREYRRVNVDGTRHVISAALRAGAQRLVFFSTISVYAGAAGSAIDERSPVAPRSYYAESKLEAEHLALESRRSDGLPLATVLRLGAVYGPRLKGNYYRLIRALSRGLPVTVGEGRNRRTLIFEDDVAEAAWLASTHPRAAGRVYNVSDGQFPLMRDIVASICGALKRKPPRLWIPDRTARWSAGLWSLGHKMLGRHTDLGPATIEKYLEDVAVRSDLIREELGFLPRADMQTGWMKTIDGLRRDGRL